MAQSKRTQEIEESKIIGREGSVSFIPLDLHRTFSAFCFFQPEGPLHDSLKEVLEAYVSYRPDIGYVFLIFFSIIFYFFQYFYFYLFYFFNLI